MTKSSPSLIDPHDPTNHNIPLWLVYGSSAFPSIIGCRIRINAGVPTIWGLGRGRRYMTLGVGLDSWPSGRFARDVYEFYKDQDAALERLKKLTTPNKDVL